MLTIKKLLEKTFEEKKKRKWPKLFWAIDLHATIISGVYSKNNEGAVIAPDAIDVLKYLTEHPEHVLILWTSSYKEPIKNILDKLGKYGIKFDYVNKNPECPNTELCDFKGKFYFNILLDDKGFFEMDKDWTEIKQFLLERKINES